MEEDQQRLEWSENQGVCWEAVSPMNVRSYTHEVSTTGLKEVDNKEAVVGGG